MMGVSEFNKQMTYPGTDIPLGELSMQDDLPPDELETAEPPSLRNLFGVLKPKL